MAHGSDDEVDPIFRSEQLGDAFLGGPSSAFLVFGLQRVLDPDALQDFRGRNSTGRQNRIMPLSDRLYNAQDAVVGDADDVAGNASSASSRSLNMIGAA
jgi:hypothetical protein